MIGREEVLDILYEGVEILERRGKHHFGTVISSEIKEDELYMKYRYAESSDATINSFSLHLSRLHIDEWNGQTALYFGGHRIVVIVNVGECKGCVNSCTVGKRCVFYEERKRT